MGCWSCGTMHRPFAQSCNDEGPACTLPAACPVAQALAELAELPGGGSSAGEEPRAAIAAEACAVAALVAVMVGQQPPQLPGPPGSVTGPPAGDLAGHISLLLRR